ncbi:UNVERIFIED_CONTAM: dTDP-4-dehydrorhamnose reductase [Brevibacillus sp. OAP136]
MNVLLLGASGYVGSAIYHRLASQPSVTVYGTACSAELTSESIRVDVTRYDQLEACLTNTQPSVVIWALMGQEELLIEQGLHYLLTLLTSRTRLLYLSTDGVFGDGRGDYREEDETSDIQGDSALAVYSNAKRKGEEMISRCHQNHLILRTGPVYGVNPDGIDRRGQSLAAALATGKPYSRADNVFRTFVHVDDLAEAIAELCETEVTGKLHVGPQKKESHFSFSQKMAKHLGYSPDLVVREQMPELDARAIGLPFDTSLCTE